MSFIPIYHPEEIEVEEINIILKIPKETARLHVEATVLNPSGNPQKIAKTLSVSEIQKARQDFLDYVEFGDDYDAEYTLTEKGRELLERMKAGEEIPWDMTWKENEE